MRRTTSAAEDHAEFPADLVPRIAVEHGSPAEAPGRHRHAGTTATVEHDRSLTRRLAPLAVGACVMLVATTVATVVRPESDPTGPGLTAAINRSDPAISLAQAGPAVDPASRTTVDLATIGLATAVPATIAAAPATPEKAPEPTTKAPPAPVEPSRTVSASDGDGTQAGAAQGWTQVDGDEFNGGMSDNWGPYEGAGHAGNGRRSADAISVENGSLVIRGDSGGNTGGMSWKKDQRFGKWEMRARFPKGDEQYHPVLLLWPNGSWPQGGEVDFAETTSASSDVSFFLHYSSSNQQKYAHMNLDITQWHNYAVEWVDGRITGYVDGEKWFESTDRDTLPPDQMHAAIQLDYFPDGGSPQPSEMHVDYMRIYK